MPPFVRKDWLNLRIFKSGGHYISELQICSEAKNVAARWDTDRGDMLLLY